MKINPKTMAEDHVVKIEITREQEPWDRILVDLTAENGDQAIYDTPVYPEKIMNPKQMTEWALCCATISFKQSWEMRKEQGLISD